MQNEAQVVRSAGKQAIRQFLQGQTCFSCLRTSGKVVVFDIRIPIQLAFYALVEHGEFQVSFFRKLLVGAYNVGLLTSDPFRYASGPALGSRAMQICRSLDCHRFH